MKKREREITALYGLSLIRKDVLEFPYPTKLTRKEKLIAAIHWMAFLSPVIVAIMLGFAFAWASKFL
jgi:hypothetical protein